MFKLKKVFIPSSVTSIGRSSFEECKSLEEIIFEQPSTISLIERSVFDECSSLRQISFPPSITVINKNLFRGCSSLDTFVVHSSVTKIDDNAFEDCVSLENISFSFPSSLLTIGKNNFENNNNIKIERESSNDFSIYAIKSAHLIISNQIAKIKSNYEEYRENIQKITLTTSVTYIGFSAFNRCLSLTQIIIPSSITSIGNSSFFGCSSLKEISIPSSVTSIGKNAFADIKLLNIKVSIIHIPNNFLVNVYH